MAADSIATLPTVALMSVVARNPIHSIASPEMGVGLFVGNTQSGAASRTGIAACLHYAAVFNSTSRRAVAPVLRYPSPFSFAHTMV